MTTPESDIPRRPGDTLGHAGPTQPVPDLDLEAWNAAHPMPAPRESDSLVRELAEAFEAPLDAAEIVRPRHRLDTRYLAGPDPLPRRRRRR